MNNPVLLTILVLLMIGYVFLYLGGRKYLETFKDVMAPPMSHKRFDSNGNPNTNANRMLMPEKPYRMDEINDVDDYEMSAIFQNQGSREASKKEISDAMTRYPLDWSAQGPGSQYFQENQTKYLKQQQGIPQPESYYKDMNTNMLLPDSVALEEEERKILQTYKPESSKGLLQYSVDDVKGLLTKLYDKKGLIPVIEKSQQGENIWEIVEVKEKNPKIVWEDGQVEQMQLETQQMHQEEIMKKRGEDTITVPYTVSDVAAGQDPFFSSNPSTRIGKTDYTTFTPGLERMFAPSHPVKSWF